MKISIIGNGFVGKATQLIKCSVVQEMYVYDIVPEKCIPIGITIEQICDVDIIFISLPTPMKPDGSCYTEIIEEVVLKLNKLIKREKTSIVLRSTVPPGTSDRLGINFMPEFLTEKNWENDFINCNNWIFGHNSNDINFQEKINKLFRCAYEENILKYFNISFVSNKEAEMIKYVKNCFLATKVSFFNEIAEFSDKIGIDYDVIRKHIVADDRIGSSHTNVPGHDGHYGFGGTCLPKDSHAFLAEMTKHGMTSYIIKAVIDRNEKVDRPEKDWMSDSGRTII